MKEENRMTLTETPPQRIAEDRAAKLLERAAALDAKRNSEIEIDQLREAAYDAGISREAFEEALRESASEEVQGKQPKGKRGGGVREGTSLALASKDVAHYASMLRDVLGDDGQVTVTDVIEWRDEEGLSVSINPSTSAVTSSVTAEGKLRTKLLGVLLPALLPLLFFFAWAIDDEEGAIALVGGLLVVLASMLGTAFVNRRERKALRKKAERIRRQLQRLITGPAQE